MWNEVIDKHPGISGSVFGSYVSLWARLPGIALRDIVNSFEETAEIIRVPAMRHVLAVFTPESYARVYPAFQANLERSFRTDLRHEGVDAGLLEIARDEITEILGREDLPGPEIGRRLQRLKGMKPVTLAAVLNALCAQRRLVRARVRGGFQNARFTYAVWSEWVPGVRVPADRDFNAAVSELAELYFDAYPGATVEDFRIWGGWDEAQLHPLEQHLEYSRLASAAQPLAETWAGWHLLPPLDALTMAYRATEAWLPPQWRDWAIDAGNNATSVILYDGQCVGVWDLLQLEDVLHEVRVALFHPELTISFELEHVIAGLARFLEIEIGEVIQVRPEHPLREQGDNAFRSPLRDAVTAE